MKTINIKTELKEWLIDNVTNTIVNKTRAKDNEEFNNWAKSFTREEAVFVVNAEFCVDWEYDKRTEITEEEALEYSSKLWERIVKSWQL